jgi:aminoglycoside phosphotransferase (APT) family kinase protein
MGAAVSGDRQQRFTGTKAVSPGLELDTARLSAYLADAVAGFQGPLRIAQFKGGQSNPTYRLDSPSGRYVLRRKPPGQLLPSAHAVDREYRVIKALHDTGFPVPRPHVLCTDETVAGTMFFVMDYVPGRIFWDAALPELEKSQRHAIYDAMNDTLARLHGVDYQAAGLGDFGKPGNYFARQISRWSKQYRASGNASITAMEQLLEWLPANIPDDDTVSLVHGDFRLDNLVFDPDRPVVRAVLDWELSTLGHPLGDFTYHLMQWRLPPSTNGVGISSLVGKDLRALGIPTEEQYVRLYCQRTGRDDIDNRAFYAAYNFFRMAAILQGIAGRVAAGTAASEHARAMAANVEPMARLGWQFAQQAAGSA